MPKLWNDTIDAHKRSVRDALLDAVGAIAHERGIRAVTMSQVAESAGVGRATLYKYFPDVESLLLAWHERHLDGHMEHLRTIRGESENPLSALQAVLTEYAMGIFHAGADRRSELGVFLHSREQVTEAAQHLDGLVRELVAAGIDEKQIRNDAPPEEVAAYCLSAMGAAATVGSAEAVHRLVALTTSGIATGTA